MKSYGELIRLSDYEKIVFHTLESLPNKHVFQKLFNFINFHGFTVFLIGLCLSAFVSMYYDNLFFVFGFLFLTIFVMFIGALIEESVKKQKHLRTPEEAVEQLYWMKKHGYFYGTEIDDVIEFFQIHKHDKKGCYGYLKLKEEIALLKNKEIFENQKEKIDFCEKILNS